MSQFTFNQEIRFADGRYKGYNGIVKLSDGEFAQVEIKVGGEPFPVMEETRFMQDHAQWVASKTDVERALLPE